MDPSLIKRRGQCTCRINVQVAGVGIIRDLHMKMLNNTCIKQKGKKEMVINALKYSSR